MKNITFLLGIILLTTSCKSLQFSSLNRSTPLEQKLPPLEPAFDTESFALDYADIYDIPSVILSRNTTTLNNAINKATIELKIAEDTKRIFSTELIRNISESAGKTAGYVVCRRGLRSKGIKTYVNPIVSWLTLGIANVFGYTYATVRDDLEVVIDIYDLNDKVIGSYTGAGYGEAKIKLYKGYTNSDARRLAHARAFKVAMEDVKDQIKDNQNNLTSLLTNN